MGLFSRNADRDQHRSLASTIRGLRGREWESDGTGVVLNGDVGGDIQRGDSYSVRYVRADRPGSLITASFYAVEYDECPGEFAVQRQVERMVCADPSNPECTEIWSDESCDDLTAETFGSAAEAEAEARVTAEEALERGYTHEWDGQPGWGAA